MPNGYTNGSGTALPPPTPSLGGTPPTIRGMTSKPITEITASVGYVAAGADSTQILSISKTASSTATKTVDPQAVVVENLGKIPAIVMVGYQSYVDYGGAKAWKVAGHNSPTGDTAVSGVLYIHVLLQPGESIQPPMRGVISVSSDEAAGADSAPNTDEFGEHSLHVMEGTVVDFTAPNSNAYTDSGADVKNNTLSNTNDPVNFGVTVSASANSTQIRVGDLLQVENEILEVLGTYEDDPTNSSLVASDIRCKRGMYGSTNATHTDTPDIRFPFFNTYTDYDDPLKLATDANGRWWSMNFFGYGRAAADGTSFGIQPGSVCFRFYKQGYQECGLSGINSSTNSGLTASATYKIDITVDGGTLFQDLTFTLDTSNVNFGGTNGVISKIQTALDTQFYTAGNLFEKKVIVGIVNGDLRFTSGSYLSTSAILLTDTGDAGSLFDATANGRIPPADDLEDPVSALLPDKQIYDPITYSVSPNIGAYAYDDGRGNIIGKCSGSINYETGELLLVGAPPIANFEVSVIHDSPFSGKRDTGTASANLCLRPNSLIAIHANVLNKQMECLVKVSTY